MPDYRLTPEAERQLIHIYLYTLEHFGLTQAESYTVSIQSAFVLLSRNPRMGRPARDLGPDCRRHEHDAHVIFYDEMPDGILVLCVLNRTMQPGLHL